MGKMPKAKLTGIYWNEAMGAIALIGFIAQH